MAVAPPETRTGPPEWLILTLVCSAQFMVVLDISIVNVALPSIQHSLGFTEASLQWVVTAYSLTFGGLLLLGGRLADLFGRRRIFLVGLALFTASSLLGGFAQNQTTLIAARALQGVGCGDPLPRHPDHPHGDLHRAAGPGQGTRDLERGGRRRRSGRCALRWHPGPVPVVAVDPLRQRTHRCRAVRPGAPDPGGVDRRGPPQPPGHRRVPDRHRRPDGAGVRHRPHRRGAVGLHLESGRRWPSPPSCSGLRPHRDQAGHPSVDATAAVQVRGVVGANLARCSASGPRCSPCGSSSPSTSRRCSATARW